MWLYSRVAVIVGIWLLTTLFSLIVPLPARTLALRVSEFSVRLTLPAPWFLGLLLSGLVCVGSDSLIRRHPAFQRDQLYYALTFWPLPGLIAWLSVPLLHRLGNLWLGGGLALSVTILLATILLEQYHSVPVERKGWWAARWFLNLVAYALAFVFFRVIRGLGLSPLTTAIGVALVGSLLSLGILRRSQEDTARTWFYALVSGILLGQAAWALRYWPLAGLYSDLLVFWLFYLITSVIYQRMSGRLTRAALAEFALLGVAGFGAVCYLARMGIGG